MEDFNPSWNFISISVYTPEYLCFIKVMYGFSLFLSYEIQVESEARGKGLGKFLMQILEMMAHRFVKCN